jgi:DNA-directed RNA polymerase subunit N (RpoN/RPB10)
MTYRDTDFFIVLRADKKNGTPGVKTSRSTMDFPLPIRCFTCNLPIAGKWKTFLQLVKTYRKQDGRSETDDLVYLTKTTKSTAEGRAMDELGLVRECCRRHFFTHPGV